MSKKIMTVIILTVIIAILVIGCRKTNEIIKNDNELEPISKEVALKVLQAQYGDMIDTTVDDIKQEGENYIVDVHVDLYVEPTIDDLHPDEKEEHNHRESIGTHKINIYTGELIKPESNK